jgi:type VI secretion system secreted protein Hcp
MAFDAFLKIKEIPGDSTIKAHKDEIEVESYGWGISNATDPTGGGGGVGKPVLSDFRIMKSVDRSSPLLFAAVCTGEHFPEAVFTVEEMGTLGKKPTGNNFLKLTLTDVFVSGFQASGASNFPTETVTLGFSKMEIEVAGAKSASCGRPE